MRLRKREEEKKLGRDSSREGLYMGRSVQGQEHGFAGLNVPASRFGRRPPTAKKDVLHGAAQKMVVSCTSVAKGVWDIGGAEAEIGTSGLEVVAEEGGFEREEETTGLRRGEKLSKKSFHDWILHLVGTCLGGTEAK